MNRAEYEKLCDEAFGKPEKRNILKEYKNRFLGAAAVLVLAITVLAVCLLHEPDPYVHREVRKPVFLQVQSHQEDGFYGVDLDGLLWRVSYDMRTVDGLMTSFWIRFEGEPTVVSDIPSSLAVTADSCWYGLADERVRFGYCYDICEFDIDRDGVVEQCVLGAGTTSGVSSFEFSVWDGESCETSIILVPGVHYFRLAFYTDGQELKIAGICKDGGAYHEDSMDVVCTDGNLEVLTEGEAIDKLPIPVKHE